MHCSLKTLLLMQLIGIVFLAAQPTIEQRGQLSKALIERKQIAQQIKQLESKGKPLLPAMKRKYDEQEKIIQRFAAMNDQEFNKSIEKAQKMLPTTQFAQQYRKSIVSSPLSSSGATSNKVSSMQSENEIMGREKKVDMIAGLAEAAQEKMNKALMARESAIQKEQEAATKRDLAINNAKTAKDAAINKAEATIVSIMNPADAQKATEMDAAEKAITAIMTPADKAKDAAMQRASRMAPAQRTAAEKAALAEYKKKETVALGNYDKAIAAAKKKYAEVEKSSLANYNNALTAAESQYQKAVRMAENDYKKIEALASAEYKKADAEYNNAQAEYKRAEEEYKNTMGSVMIGTGKTYSSK